MRSTALAGKIPTDVAEISPAELTQLAKDMGADPSANRGNSVPMIKINNDVEDADGKPLPFGHMYATDQEQTVYAKTIKFRPLSNHFQYSHYDPDENKTVSKTILATNFQEEFIDNAGTIRCGRPGGKTWKNMDKDARKPYEDITAFRLVRGLVSYEGKTTDGTKVTVENIPCIMRLKGANFMPFDEEYVDRLPKGRMLWDYWLTVSLEKKKNGSVTYFIQHFEADFSSPAPLDRQTVDTIKAFSEMVGAENAKIRAEHEDALRKRNSDGAAYDSIGGDDNLENDVDDAIPY